MIAWILIAAYIAAGLLLFASDCRGLSYMRPAYVTGSVGLKLFVILAWPLVWIRRRSYPKPPVPSDKDFGNEDWAAWSAYGNRCIREVNQRFERLNNARSESQRCAVESEMAKHYSNAVDAYRKALELNPSDIGSKTGLDLAEAGLKRYGNKA